MASTSSPAPVSLDTRESFVKPVTIYTSVTSTMPAPDRLYIDRAKTKMITLTLRPKMRRSESGWDQFGGVTDFF